MKKAFYSVIVSLFAFVLCNPSHAQETVYLRNGSVVRGLASEIPGKDNVQVRCSDGSLLKYSMDEVVEIEKGFAADYSQAYIGSSGKNIKRGYRGFVDFSYNENFNRYRGFEFTTMHGYQGNPYLFIGAGVGLNFDYCAGIPYYQASLLHNYRPVEWVEDYVISVPLYLNVRADIPFEYGGPFIDYKLGMDLYEAANDSLQHPLEFSIPLFLNLRGYYPLRNGFGGPFAEFRIGFDALNFGSMGLSCPFMTSAVVGWRWETGDGGMNLSVGWRGKTPYFHSGRGHQFMMTLGYDF